MDAFLLGTYIQRKRTEGTETFSDGSDKKWDTFEIISSVISFLIGVFAAYLSWSCNTIQGYNIFPKIVFAFFAWIFGLFYLILYGLFRSPCRILSENPTGRNRKIDR